MLRVSVEHHVSRIPIGSDTSAADGIAEVSHLFGTQEELIPYVLDADCHPLSLRKRGNLLHFAEHPVPSFLIGRLNGKLSGM